MALTATDWTIDRATGNIRYTGGDHDSSPTYATVIQFHRWVQDLADDAVAVPASGDELDITNILPSARSTDNIITLLGSYNIDDAASEHLYDGSIIQESGDTIYDGIVNFGVASVQIQVMQDGAVLSDDWWNYGGAGLNASAAQGISHRFMLKVREDGVDIDGRRLLGTSRTFGNTYSEFPINGTSRGNNVLALTESDDLNNETAAGTVATWTTITNTEGLRLIDVNNDSTDEEYYSEWNRDSYTINQFFERLKWLSRAGSGSTLNGLNGEVFRGITHSFGYDGETGGISISTNDMLAWGTAIVYSGETSGPFTVGEAIHEDTATPSWKGRIIAVDDDGTTGTLIVDVESGTVLTTETFTGQSSAAQATVNGTPTAVADGAVLHVMADDTTDDILYVQVLSGLVPADNDILYYVGTDLATADATDYLDVANEVATITSRTIQTPFVGVSTGTAIIGSYGLGIEAADLTSADKVFDLTNTQITPPNNVINTVAGLVSGEDRVIVAPWDGSTTDAEGNPAIEKDQLSLNATLSTDDITAVVTTEAAPHGTPSSGYMRVTDNDGFERRLHYSSWSGSGPTTYVIDTTDGNEDFNSVNATAGNDIYLSYIDELASGATATWTAVHSTGTDDLVVVVRDGDSTPIKEFISSWTFSSANATITAIRTTDA